MSAGEEDSDFLAIQRYAIVTGSNKGIGLEVCNQLASKGILVVLTARDENKGKKTMETLKDHALSQHANIVNNAAVLGVNVDFHALEASIDDKGAQSITRLVLLPMDGQGQSGLFFYRDEISSF
ncbi:hypothetical protein L1887_34089 [Cichorium endivia]|nr:hypothetical protein L1887_34089 [Cichorium endivia]